MRLIVFTLLLFTLGLSGATPSESALKVLEKLQDTDAIQGTPEGLAISRFCSPGKLRAIDQNWKRRAAWLNGEKVTLASGPEKIDGNLAAVLIKALPMNGPDSVTIISLGLQLVEGEWKVTPVEGTFDNVGLGYDPGLRERVKALEIWMAMEKVNLASELRESELKKFHESMSRIVDPKILSVEDPEKALDYFLTAAEEGRTDEVLVWQGILERDEFSDVNWENEIRVTRLGMKGQDARNAWRILRTGNVMKVVMDGSNDDEDASYLVSFLSSFEVEPDETTRTPIRFHLFKSSQGWRVRLPAFFAHADESNSGHQNAHQEEFNWEDRENSKEMGGIFELDHNQVVAPDPRTLMEGVVRDFSEGDLTGYLRRLYREEEKEEAEEGDPEEGVEGLELPELLDDDEEAIPLQGRLQIRGRGEASDIDERRVGRYQEAVNWWNDGTRGEEKISAKIQEVFEEGKLALGVLLIEPTQGSWEPIFLNVWMSKNEQGWIVVPGGETPMLNSLDPSLIEVRKKLSKNLKGAIAAMTNEYLALLWKTVSLFDPEGPVISEDDGRDVVLGWRRLLVNGSMMQLLDKSAIRMVPKQPGFLLRDLGFVRAGASSATVADRIIGSKAVGHFRGYSLMVDEGRGLEMSCPLIVVVSTDKGPRVLVDVEIFLETNKAKRMRNAENLEIIEAQMSPEDFVSLKAIVAWHLETAQPVWEEWNNRKAAE